MLPTMGIEKYITKEKIYNTKKLNNVYSDDE